MNTNLFKTIKIPYDELTKTDLKIYQAICTNPENMIFMSSLDFGKTLGISDASVLRFSKKMGFKKYSEFKMWIVQELDRQKSVSSRILTNLENTSNQKESDPLKKLYQEDIQTLLSFEQQVDFTEIRSLAKDILNADNIYCVGVGSSRSISSLISWQCNVMGFTSTSIEEAGYGLFEKIGKITNKDLMILVSVPKFLKDEIKLMELVKLKGVKTAVITGTQISKISSLADYKFILNIENGGMFYSYLLAIELVNLLFLEILLRDKKKFYNRLRNSEEEQKFLYY